MPLICGVSGCISDFIVFHISKVGVGFTLLSELISHLLGNNAPHIKLWGASFLNCLILTAWEWRPSCVIWLYWLLCIFYPWFQQRNLIVLRHIDIRCVFEEQWNYAAEITNEKYTSQKPNNIRRLLYLGDFMTYPS
jgi:hypothetical protein